MIAVCSIFQNEAPYLKEWIEYHCVIGVDHFFLFNDRSTDDFEAVLKPYIDNKIVDLYDCPCQQSERHFLNQRRAHVRGLNAAKGTYDWVAFVDTDEFIVPKNKRSIQELLSPYKENLGVIISWLKFGTSGIYELDKNKLMLEQLVRCSELNDEDNRITKSIIQIRYLADEFFNEKYVIDNQLDVVHFCRWEKYDGLKAKMAGYISCNGREQVWLDRLLAQINHYWCRDEKFYREVKVPRKARLLNEDFNRPLEWPESKIESYLEIYNRCEDLSIQGFLSELKNEFSNL